MTEPTVRTLSAATYDFLSIHAAISDLSRRLDACRRDSARCVVAARQLRKLREMLAAVLDGLDEEVARASALAGCLEEAPF